MSNYKESEGLGPCNTSKCPHCQNSSQNAVPDGSPHLLRCASCKNIFLPFVSATELIRMLKCIHILGMSDILSFMEKLEKKIDVQTSYREVIGRNP